MNAQLAGFLGSLLIALGLLALTGVPSSPSTAVAEALGLARGELALPLEQFAPRGGDIVAAFGDAVEGEVAGVATHLGRAAIGVDVGVSGSWSR